MRARSRQQFANRSITAWKPHPQRFGASIFEGAANTMSDAETSCAYRRLLAQMTKGGMIFVPSRAGRSHTPGEWAELDDIVRGASLLLIAVAELAGA